MCRAQPCSVRVVGGGRVVSGVLWGERRILWVAMLPIHSKWLDEGIQVWRVVRWPMHGVPISTNVIPSKAGARNIATEAEATAEPRHGEL